MGHMRWFGPVAVTFWVDTSVGYNTLGGDSLQEKRCTSKWRAYSLGGVISENNDPFHSGEALVMTVVGNRAALA